MPLTDKQRLADVSFADIDAASTTRGEGLRMLGRLVTIARPDEGSATLLIALAHLASVPWLRGSLRARFRALPGGVELEVVEDLGGGQRVPFFHRTAPVAIDELRAALPHLVLRPLRLLRQTDDAIVLGVAVGGERGSLAPPPPLVPLAADQIPQAAALSGDDDEVDDSW